MKTTTQNLLGYYYLIIIHLVGLNLKGPFIEDFIVGKIFLMDEINLAQYMF